MEPIHANLRLAYSSAIEHNQIKQFDKSQLGQNQEFSKIHS